MKLLKLKTLLFILFLGISNLYAQDYQKKFHEAYSVEKSTICKLVNKYGNINIKDWDKDSIVIDVTITIDGCRENKAQHIFESININISKENNIVSGITEITKSIRMNNGNFDIDYQIFMPKYMQLDLYNKFGNVYITELSSLVDIEVKYGSLNIKELSRGSEKPRNHIVLGYSEDSEIDKCGWLKLENKYSNIEIEEAKALIIISKYSKLEIDKCNSIVLDSKYDSRVSIDEVDKFICTGKYSSYKIDKLKDKLDLDIKYSKCRVEELAQNFSSVDILNKFGTITLGISNKSSFQLETYSKYADVKYPAWEGKVNRFSENTSTKLSGFLGSDKDTKQKINIQTSYGDVNIKEAN